MWITVSIFRSYRLGLVKSLGVKKSQGRVVELDWHMGRKLAFR